jgi:hypothetical protein
VSGLASFRAGQILTADLLNLLVDDINELTAWGVVASDFPKTDTTIAAVTGLSVAVEANASYVLDGLFYVDGPTGGDCKFNSTQPAGASGFHSIQAADTSATTAFNALNLGLQSIGGSSIVVGLIGAGTTLVVVYKGELTTVSAGTFQITFAQNAASGTSNCKAGSRLRAVRRA